jgi:hypothetical protein
MEVVLTTLFSHAAARHFGAVLAYIDPSIGSLIFQVVAASAISAGLFIKRLRERITWLITGGWRARRTDSKTVSGDEIPVGEESHDAPSRRKAA